MTTVLLQNHPYCCKCAAEHFHVSDWWEWSCNICHLSCFRPRREILSTRYCVSHTVLWPVSLLHTACIEIQLTNAHTHSQCRMSCPQLKLVNPTQYRFEHLATQLKWRLQEGRGEAVYQIGVEDNGLLVGLTDNDMKASINTLRRMAEKYGVT